MQASSASSWREKIYLMCPYDISIDSKYSIESPSAEHDCNTSAVYSSEVSLLYSMLISRLDKVWKTTDVDPTMLRCDFHDNMWTIF